MQSRTGNGCTVVGVRKSLAMGVTNEKHATFRTSKIPDRSSISLEYKPPITGVKWIHFASITDSFRSETAPVP